MKKVLFFLIAFLASVTSISANPPQSDDIVSNFRQLSLQQLFDTANYYGRKSSTDTALICYSLFINTPAKDTDIERQEKMIKALTNSAVIYYYMCDYRTAYDLLIKALFLCEKYDKISHKPTLYVNIGNIYDRFNKHDMAKVYYSKALNLCQDSTAIAVILNNLGYTELESENMDSAFYFLNKSLQISKRHNERYLYFILNSLAQFYQKEKQYDSAFCYFRLALDKAKKQNRIENEVENLSNLGNLFFEINKTDSSLFYINLSNTIATGNHLLEFLANNYLTLSKIEESKGHTKNAFEQYKKYANLKDSVFNAKNFGDINQLQHLYEVSKTNQQIEQLVIEQQIKERTIYYQRIIQLITLIMLLLVSVVLLFIFFQKKKLNTAYKALFEKNLEIIDLQNSSEGYSEKYKKSALTYAMQTELLDKILILMEDTAIICDTKFTVDKLAELVQSNHAYVSQVINTVLKKNFRSFLNSYRIREAQRLFSKPDATKYTIESVALQVGFKSRSAFYDTFKEITGVSPNFYLKSIQKQYAL